jgi:hypothetical protein
MIRSLFTLIITCCSLSILAQTSHLSLVYDVEGADFDYPIRGMVGANDSLYVLCNTPDWRGKFYRIDGNGDGYKEIATFDGDDYGVSSIAGNDTVIYITTYNTPALYKYSLKDYSFKLVKKFDWSEVSAIQIKYITDSVLWFSSDDTMEDYGSIFSTNYEGTNLKKLHSFTNPDLPRNPADFFFFGNKVYISCWGGGSAVPNPWDPGTSTYAGGIIRMNLDGTGYEDIISGGIENGTNPTSLVVRGDKLYGVFAYSSTQHLGGQFFRSNLDGTEYDSLGGLPERSLGRLLPTNNLIYGVGTFSVFGINPANGQIRISNDLLSNPDFGTDVVTSPAYLNKQVYITAQQGGPNGGGTILKWINKAPQIDDSYIQSINGRVRSTKSEISLNELFTDPELDHLSFSWEYNQDFIAISESDGIITLTPLTADAVEVRITAIDGWAGRKSVIAELSPDGTTNFIAIDDEIITGIDNEQPAFYVYPNPTSSILKLSASSVKSIVVLGTDGKIYATFHNPKDEIDISSLHNGVYYVKSHINGNVNVQRIIKN